jgi:hypothetical protein
MLGAPRKLGFGYACLTSTWCVVKLMIIDRVIVVSDSFERPGLLKALWGTGVNYIIYAIQFICFESLRTDKDSTESV